MVYYVPLPVPSRRTLHLVSNGHVQGSADPSHESLSVPFLFSPACAQSFNTHLALCASVCAVGRQRSPAVRVHRYTWYRSTGRHRQGAARVIVGSCAACHCTCQCWSRVG